MINYLENNAIITYSQKCYNSVNMIENSKTNYKSKKMINSKKLITVLSKGMNFSEDQLNILDEINTFTKGRFVEKFFSLGSEEGFKDLKISRKGSEILYVAQSYDWITGVIKYRFEKPKRILLQYEESEKHELEKWCKTAPFEEVQERMKQSGPLSAWFTTSQTEIMEDRMSLESWEELPDPPNTI